MPMPRAGRLLLALLLGWAAAASAAGATVKVTWLLDEPKLQHGNEIKVDCGDDVVFYWNDVINHSLNEAKYGEQQDRTAVCATRTFTVRCGACSVPLCMCRSRDLLGKPPTCRIPVGHNGVTTCCRTR